MTTERVYSSKLSHERAIEELERCAGSQFDPDVVAVFLECLERDEIAALKAVGAGHARPLTG
jgi:HD-GYP domain-containing protein (c-di-GMP phosphodiesterase class II)